MSDSKNVPGCECKLGKKSCIYVSGHASYHLTEDGVRFGPFRSEFANDAHLADVFAGRAMAALLSSPQHNTLSDCSIANAAYEIACAMMRERNRRVAQGLDDEGSQEGEGP